MSLNKTQIAVIAGSLILIVLLIFADTKLLPKEKPVASGHAGPAEHQHADISDLVKHATDALNPDQKKTIQQLQDSKAFDKIVTLWDSLRQPAIAAYYSEEVAKMSSTEQSWQEAGNRYYAASQFVSEDERPLLFNKAMECFEKVTEINPKNVEAKISLAACYVEGSPDPMKGIGMLREIEKTDSNNVNLQLSFAFFSEKSGQWDRAIARFEKVLKIQPDFIEAYLHLADAYQQKGDNAKAIENLENYMKLVDDVTIKTEVQDYINKLKNS